MNKKKKICLLAGIIFLIDRVLKIFVHMKLEMFQEKVVIPNFFSLYYMENKGAAFGIFKNSSIFLILVAIMCLLIFGIMLYRETEFSFWSFFAFGLLIGGIMGNLWDRLFYGGVTDYLAFMLFHHQFPVFNFADIAITIGVFCFLVSYFVEEKRKVS